jgi:proteasome accessory factor B
MASEKNERLVNLTIALLATKKFLTKSQIFTAVAGYEGSSEATDRMFERDKEELRALGIEIEMKNIDPLFDDEIGYRISPERYRFNLGELNTEEVSLLALAAEAWKESALSDIARSTSVRLQSLGINSDFSDLPLAPTIANVPPNISDILEAVDSSRVIQFKYLNIEDELEEKKVAPLGVYSQNGNWYLYAIDQQKSANRSYRLDRIDGTITKTRQNFQKTEFEIPKNHFPSVEVLYKVRRDHALELISAAEIISEDDEWITCKRNFSSESLAISQILRFSPNILVLQPIQIVSQVTKSLNEMAQLYG